MTLATLPVVREDSLPERQEYAKALSVSNLLPAQYRGKPENVLYAIEFGRAIGVEPIVAINQVHIIEQKPSASSALISSLVRRAGHRLRIWVERDDRGQLVKAVATITRHDDPDFTFRAEWTMVRANAAGVTGKSVWKNYPEAMLKARAITEVAREACEEALNGIGYTPEELGADQNADGSWVVTDAAPTRQNRPGQTIRDAVTPSAGASADGFTPPVDEPPSAPPPLVESSERMISEPQQKKMAALMRENGITDRDSALAFVTKVIGRSVISRNELTLAEAGRVIDTLEAAEDEPVDADVVEDNKPEADALWQQIMTAWPGTTSELNTAFTQVMGGVAPEDASEAELDGFLKKLKAGEL